MTDQLKQIKQDIPITLMAKKLGYSILDRGTRQNINCPFCQDHNQHMQLYPGSNRYFCHKCRAAGDSIDLAIKGHNYTIQDVKNLFGYIDHQPGKEPQKTADSCRQKRPEIDPQRREQIIDLLLEICFNMELTKAGMEYLTNRGLSFEIIKKYELKSIDDPKATARHLLEKYELDILLDAGLFDYSVNQKPYFAFFMPAIVFPHFDLNITEISYLSTRNLSGDVKSFKLHNVPAKYYFGNECKHSETVYVFEGIISALSFGQMTGRDNFIALNGLCTPARYNELRELMPGKRVILALDPDEAGKKALAEIEKPFYMDWRDIAEQITGSRQLPVHPNGKAFDANDYLILTQQGRY